ncbi:MAG: hypothetical protein LBQ66_03850 [Planctomycetaceae bacterium]|nr:hypothetical protein [Planctomycetaceae bacterium]
MFEMIDNRFVELRYEFDSVSIFIPPEVKLFSWETIMIPVVTIVFALIFGKYVIIFFVFVLFDEAVPFWFRLVLLPVNLVLFLIGFYVFCAVIFEMYSRKVLRFTEEGLLIVDKLFFIFRKRRFCLSDLGDPVMQSYPNCNQATAAGVIVIPLRDGKSAFRFPAMKISQNNELIEIIKKFLLQYN